MPPLDCKPPARRRSPRGTRLQRASPRRALGRSVLRCSNWLVLHTASVFIGTRDPRRNAGPGGVCSSERYLFSDTSNQPKHLVADSKDTAEKCVPHENQPPADCKESNTSSKQPNDETSINPKKKKRNRKKKKKKKDDNLSSDLSMGENQPKKMRITADSSDSESSDNAKDETLDSMQDGPASLESQPGSLTANIPAAPSEDTQVVQSETSAATVVQSETSAATVEARPATQPEEAPVNPQEEKSNPPKSTQDQKLKTAPADTPTPISVDSKSDASQSNLGKGAKSTDPPDQETDKKKSKNKKDTSNTKQSQQDQNANVEQRGKQKGQIKPKEKSQQDQMQKDTVGADQNMVFGPEKPPTADGTGSSVDPEGSGEHMGGQQSGSEQDSTAAQHSDADKGSEDGSKKSSSTAAQPPKRPTRNKNIAASDRLTIYFHAVLSKDFKFDPNEDRIFIRAGHKIGNWDENTVELSVRQMIKEFMLRKVIPQLLKDEDGEMLYLKDPKDWCF
ncbi:E3 ubiquitin-protein ligase rnf213-alpha [Liparis tanakae]|uniref:E3 ubiquitin-protein ligase rnf213-alpha n=1 Tax=Liparis tanakae TaxID=230148 RepID=A0A4Z2I4E0_9TELE|nr:E3 ubiquitin-protein ligase rnf213-alpha [Liparis tanakae]